MISDADVVFSFLFLALLLTHGGKYNYFFFVICVGNLTYAAGATYFAPNQKFRTMKLVKNLMCSNPEEFHTEVNGRPCHVKLSSPATPGDARSSTFDDLEMSPEGLERFRAGLSAYKLGHTWNACEIKNGRNCFERKHGIPFFRLARIGFMSEPSPKDLSGILNANALYTFSTGLLQIAFGVTMGYEFGLTFETIIPLSISSFSLVLSFVNVIFDFAGILTEIEAERRLKDAILQASAGALKRDKDVARQTFDDEKAQIGEEFQGRSDANSLASKAARLKQLSDTYELNLIHIDNASLNVLSTELKMYRKRVAKIRSIIAGQEKQKMRDDISSVDAVMKDRELITAVLYEQKQKVIDDAAEQLRQLNFAADGETKMSQILSERERKVSQIDAAINDILAGRPTTDRV